MNILEWINSHLELFSTFITTTGIIVGAVFAGGRWIVKVLNKSLNDKLDEKLEGLYYNDFSQYRYQIVAFAGDLHNGIRKTIYEFEAIIEIHKKYEDLAKKYKFKNHYLDGEWEYIEEQYELLKSKERRVNVNEQSIAKGFI